MANKNAKISWLIATLGQDLNWWVKEVSDPVHWDVDALSVIDPKQWAYIVDLLDSLREFGLDTDLVEAAFIPMAIDKDLGDQTIRMVKSKESLFDSEEMLFALPDVVDEETGPYADLLDHITDLRIKFINDAIDFEQNLTQTELEEELRDDISNIYFEGKAMHFFSELTAILEYVPAGYELDDDDDDDSPRKRGGEEDIAEDIPDFEDSNESIEEDDTMKWDEDDEEEDEEDEQYEGAPPDELEDEEEDK